LRSTTEQWGPTPAQRRYEGRADLGNTQPGDGERFKGHGFIQVTGRFNHARVRDRLRERFPDVPDFEAEPERLAELPWAALSAADYWDDKGLNALADAGDFAAITRKINGGLNGQADRLARWGKAKRALAPGYRPEPISLPIEPAKENDVAPAFIAAVLPSLISAIPELAKMFGSGSAVSERNIKAAEVVVGIAKEAIGARNEQELLETMQADPQAVETVRAAVKENWYQLTEVGGGIPAAREAAAKVQGERNMFFNPALWISMILLVMPFMLLVDVLFVHPDSYDTDGLRTQIVTGVLAVIMVVSGFWLGSSSSSKSKDEALAKR
jgi:putative chitinase